MAPAPAITDLPALVARLSGDDAARFARIYHVSMAEARLRVPAPMAPWVERTFGSVPSVERQRIVRVSNVVSGEGTLFNSLRGRRPVRAALRADDSLAGELADDAWASPLEQTPEDLFGRIESEHGTTAANVAKYDSAHGIVIFTQPDPLAFTAASIAGHLALVRDWLAAAHAADPEAVYPYVLWNCLWRAGGSIVHGHMQAQLARARHYAKIERLRHDAEGYRTAHGAGYFEDLLAVHRSLGLAWEVDGVAGLAHLTPAKEKEVLLLGDGLDDRLAAALYDTLRAFRDVLGVRSFNMGVLLPPVAPVSESWAGFPTLARIVDRGDLGTRTSDIGGMEMFAEAVVASDPFDVHRAITTGEA